MLDLLLTLYNKNRHNHMKINFWKIGKWKLVIIFVSLLAVISYLITILFFFENKILLYIHLCILILLMLIMHCTIWIQKKFFFDIEYNSYKISLDLLRRTLKDNRFSFYSKEKIGLLIKQIDYELEIIEKQEGFFKPLKVLVSAIILPLLTIFLSNYGYENKIDFVNTIAFIISGGLFALSLYYLARPTINELINSRTMNLRALRSKLIDIQVMDKLH